MSPEEPTPEQSRELRVTVGGEVVVPTQPEELAYPLRRAEYDIFCEGETAGSDERWRDVSIGIAATALLGLLSLIPSVDWEHAFAHARWVILFPILLAAIFLSTVAIFIYFFIRIRRHRCSSAYARVRSRIDDFFKDQGK